MKLADEGKSEATINARYKWYNRKYLSDFRRCVEEGGSHSMKREEINKRVLETVKELSRKMLPIRGYMIRAFGRRYAMQANADWFKASRHWMDDFKKKNRIGSRKVTKFVSRAQIQKTEEDKKNHKEFLEDFKRLSRYFVPRLIWNIDQTGIEYEQSNKRILAFRGARDVFLRIDSFNKRTD